MGITIVGVNHRTAPVELRERLYWPLAETSTILERISVAGTDAVLLSTCNRTEFYVAQGAAQTLELIWDLAAERLGQPVDPYTYVAHDREAVSHLFRVAAGLDSLVLGESQIQGQVREAWEASRRHAGPLLSRLFQDALHAGGRVRAETRLGTGAASVPLASVELARKIFGDLSGRRALVLGSGDMAELAMGCLVSEGVRSVMVAHRQLDRAAQVAERLGGRALEFADAWPLFGEVDLVVSSTAAPHAIVTPERVAEHVARRAGRPLCVLDIAVPRDVDPAVGALDSVFLYDIDDLQGVVSAGIGSRKREIPAAERIIDREVAVFWKWYAGRGAVDAIRALRDRAEALRAAEVEHALRKLRHLDPADQERVVHLTRALMNKLLHQPTVRLRESAGNGAEGPLAEAARELFGLDEAPGDAGEAPARGRASET